YGGGGIYNSYTLTTAHHASFRPVVVHEFGHSFAGLADEYYYDDQYSNYYFPDCEPWEPNITTMNDFSSKWKDMLGEKGVSVIEGGGDMSKGVWRAGPDCRMKTTTASGFCPVCRRAIERMIKFYTE
ncbi:MAG: peptidase M64, partial [Bacteroidales bacterium]|nr:peptidase M64 [Bacteroidales bacterium]